MLEEKENRPFKSRDILIIVLLLILVILLFVFGEPLKIFQRMSLVLKDFYKTDYNFSKAKIVHGINLNFYFYAFVWTAAFLLRTFQILVKKTHLSFKKTPPSLPISRIALGVFILFPVIQVINQTNGLSEDWDKYWGKSIQQKYSFRYPYDYGFAEFALQNLPDQCTGNLVTDFDPNKNLEPYMLRYFLYPKINLIYGDESKKDCHIVFRKKDPLNSVPPDYQIVGEFGRYSLVAVKPVVLKR